jgi:drug/metabolite transporter (DMT)-like permease
LPVDVMLVVLLGALLHASWNTAVKSGRDVFLDTVLIASGGAVVAAAAIPFLPLPLAASWPFAAVSATIHVAYFALVAAAYRAGDMSFAYPLMRGTAPLLVALASGPLLGEAIGATAWAGMLLISGGILGLTLVYRRPGRPILAPTGFALANAVVIATYTFVDGVGVRLSGDAMAYTAWMLLLTAVPLLAWSLRRRPATFVDHLRAHWRLGLFGGACSFASYALALWAMTQAPIAPVAALRETSILFAMGLAALVLKERFGLVRSLAAAAIAAGVMTLRLA